MATPLPLSNIKQRYSDVPMGLTEHLSVPAPSNGQAAQAPHASAPIRTLVRRHERVPVKIRAVLHRGTRFESIEIRNISLGGAGLANCQSVMDRERVTITLLSGRQIEAIARWWLAGHCGVQFVQPLEPNDPLLGGRTSPLNT